VVQARSLNWATTRTDFNLLGAFMLLRRLTIVWLLIAGLAIVAGVFADRKHDTYRDQTVFGPLASAQVKPGQHP